MDAASFISIEAPHVYFTAYVRGHKDHAPFTVHLQSVVKNGTVGRNYSTVAEGVGTEGAGGAPSPSNNRLARKSISEAVCPNAWRTPEAATCSPEVEPRRSVRAARSGRRSAAGRCRSQGAAPRSGGPPAAFHRTHVLCAHNPGRITIPHPGGVGPRLPRVPTVQGRVVPGPGRRRDRARNGRGGSFNGSGTSGLCRRWSTGWLMRRVYRSLRRLGGPSGSGGGFRNRGRRQSRTMGSSPVNPSGNGFRNNELRQFASDGLGGQIDLVFTILIHSFSGLEKWLQLTGIIVSQEKIDAQDGQSYSLS